jgi:hypothetical protein
MMKEAGLEASAGRSLAGVLLQHGQLKAKMAGPDSK